jgi:hypothetical protein
MLLALVPVKAEPFIDDQSSIFSHLYRRFLIIPHFCLEIMEKEMVVF